VTSVRRALIAVFAYVALAPSAVADEVSTATCDADLAAVDTSFVETQARLEKAGSEDQAEKCAAIRHHIEVMANGSTVPARLPDGPVGAKMSANSWLRSPIFSTSMILSNAPPSTCRESRG
jgi:hypothetical protein